MTSVSAEISVDANDELWSMNGQFDVQRTVIIGLSSLPGTICIPAQSFQSDNSACHPWYEPKFDILNPGMGKKAIPSTKPAQWGCFLG